MGGQLIGSSWASIFSCKGFDVLVYDIEKNVKNEFYKKVKLFLEELKYINKNFDVEQSISQIRFVDEIYEICTECSFIQDCSPEIVEIKQELFSQLDQKCPKNVVLSSSSSGMPISLITQNLTGKDRCIVSHPVNPPHLIPV